MKATISGNPARTTIIVMFRAGAAQSINVSPESYVRMEKKKLMMSVTINSNAFHDVATRTLTNAHLLWTASKSAKVTRIALPDAVH